MSRIKAPPCMLVGRSESWAWWNSGWQSSSHEQRRSLLPLQNDPLWWTLGHQKSQYGLCHFKVWLRQILPADKRWTFRKDNRSKKEKLLYPVDDLEFDRSSENVLCNLRLHDYLNLKDLSGAGFRKQARPIWAGRENTRLSSLQA